MDIDVALARLQIGELRVSQRRVAGDRARRIGRAERDRDTGISAGRGAAMDVRRSRGAAEAGELDAVRDLLCRGVDIDLRRAFAGGLHRRHLGVPGEVRLVADCRRARPAEGRGGREKTDDGCGFAHDVLPIGCILAPEARSASRSRGYNGIAPPKASRPADRHGHFAASRR